MLLFTQDERSEAEYAACSKPSDPMRTSSIFYFRKLINYQLNSR